MKRFVKKPIPIEALQWTGENTNEILEFAQGQAEVKGTGLFISTLEGAMRVSKNDYVIKGAKGEFYPCKPDVFDMTYVPESDMGTLSDGYHTFNELYEFRKIYNAALFNEWAKMNGPIAVIDLSSESDINVKGKFLVHKSWKHNDGELCFGGGWFIVSALLSTGLISNHYEAKDWDLFQVPEVEKALFPFDGHTSNDVLERLKGLGK
jgi:hypothetical protein